MKRFISFFTVVLVLFVIAVSLTKFVSSDIETNVNELPRQPHIGTASFNSLPEAERPARTSELLAPQASEVAGNILLVNPDNPLPNDYCPENLINLYGQQGRHFQLASADIEICQPVFEAMDAMFAAAQTDGVSGFIITSGIQVRAGSKP